MLNLLLAIGSSALVSIIMRLSDGKVKNTLGMLAVNYIMCAVASWGYTGFGSWFPAETGLPFTMGLGMGNGVLYLAGFVLLQQNVRQNGVVLSSTFIKLGLLVAMVVSVVFFGERPGMQQWLGFALAVAAIVLINYRPDGTKADRKWSLVLLLLAGGGGDAMSKVFEQLGNPVLSGHFLLYTFVAALICCSGLCALSKKGWPGKWEWAFGLLIGVPNFFSAKFLLAALRSVPAVIVYPVYSVATILTVTVAGVMLFRERLEKRQWMALGIILMALVLLNI